MNKENNEWVDIPNEIMDLLTNTYNISTIYWEAEGEAVGTYVSLSYSFPDISPIYVSEEGLSRNA